MVERVLTWNEDTEVPKLFVYSNIIKAYLKQEDIYTKLHSSLRTGPLPPTQVRVTWLSDWTVVPLDFLLILLSTGPRTKEL